MSSAPKTVQLYHKTYNDKELDNDKRECDQFYNVHHDSASSTTCFTDCAPKTCADVKDRQLQDQLGDKAASEAYDKGWAFWQWGTQGYSNSFGVSCYSNVPESAECERDGETVQRPLVCPPLKPGGKKGTFKEWHYQSGKGQCKTKACEFNYAVCEYPLADVLQPEVLNSDTFTKTFAIDTKPGTTYNAASLVEVPPRGETDLDPQLDHKMNQKTYNDVIMPYYCFTEVGTNTKYPNEICPPYSANAVTGQPRKQCSRIVSDGQGGQVCKKWQAQNTTNNCISSTLDASMNAYCKMHPGNGDCDCLARANPGNPNYQSYSAARYPSRAECWWKPCKTDVKNLVLQDNSVACNPSDCDPKVCASIVQNIAEDNATITSNMSANISCDFKTGTTTGGGSTKPPKPPKPDEDGEQESQQTSWFIWVMIIAGIIILLIVLAIGIYMVLKKKKPSRSSNK